MQILRKFQTPNESGTYTNAYPMHVPVSARLSDALEHIPSQYFVFVVSYSKMEQILKLVMAKQVGLTLNVDWEKWDQIQKVKILLKTFEDVHKSPQVFFEL